MYLVLDCRSSHPEIQHPAVTIIELPKSTMAIYQPLDKRAIAQMKLRYRTRLVRLDVENLDVVITSGGVALRAPRGRGLDH